jgi:quinoprotein relay system zinc metallohydrolase 2
MMPACMGKLRNAFKLGLAATLACGVFLRPATAGTTALPFAMVQTTPGDYVRVGATAEATAANLDGIANIGFIVGRDAVAVIDPGGSLADGDRLRAAIHAATPLPVRYVIMTHAHPDHVFGAAAFLPDHPAFVGHWRLPAALANRGAYDHARLASILGEAATGMPVTPTVFVHDTLSIDLGGRMLRIEAFPPAHTDTDLVVLDTASRTLWAGDLLFVGRVPALDGSITGWLKALTALQALPATHAIPGHGPAVVPWPAGAEDEKRYLQTLVKDIRAGLAAGDDIGKIAANAGQSERGHWALFDSYNGHNVIVATKELQWE